MQFSQKVIAIICFILLSQSVSANDKNAVCFVKPFDLSPENRINVLAEKGVAFIMHVKRDGKTFSSPPSVLKIERVKQIKNMTSYQLEDNSVIAIDFDTGLSIYYDSLIERGGIEYECQEVRLSRD